MITESDIIDSIGLLSKLTTCYDIYFPEIAAGKVSGISTAVTVVIIAFIAIFIKYQKRRVRRIKYRNGFERYQDEAEYVYYLS